VKLLLDTHTLLWLVDGDAQLTQPARTVIADPGNQLFISVATTWELAIKTTKAQKPLILSDSLDVYLA
jgi:PIN domain nuclease of toxin-antitoxin system